MLEKLTQIEMLKLTAGHDENWISHLENMRNSDENYSDEVFKNFTINYNTPFSEYLLGIDSNNEFFNVVRILLIKSDQLMGYCQSKTCVPLLGLIIDLPYVLIEYVKFCSRFYVSSIFTECTHIGFMLTENQHFHEENNTKLVLRTLLKSRLSREENNDYWAVIDELSAMYNTSEICAQKELLETVLTNMTRVNNSLIQIISESFDKTCNLCYDICQGVDLEGLLQIEVHKPLRNLVYSVGLMTSVTFLLLTILVFQVVSKMRSSVQGRCTVYHLVAMVTAYSCLTVTQFLDSSLASLCLINGYVMQYAFLAMFFWLNVMCFDIMHAFMTPRKTGSNIQGLGCKKLLWYRCYGWGGPLVISCLTLLMEYSDIPDQEGIFKPNFGGTKCFLRGTPVWVYLYCPIGIMIVANIIMFAITAVVIYKQSRQADMLKSKESVTTNRSNNSRLKVFVNLFVLMGINWVTEVLTWASPSNKWFFYLTDATTTLQGVFVFALFVCKPRVLRELRIRLKAAFKNNRNRLKSANLFKVWDGRQKQVHEY